MSVIIRLQNLPWSANALDIRQYFQGLSIPEGGVHIVGGELGDAFIAFSTDEDARQAFHRNNGKIKEVQITLMLSSRTEMQRVIEQARSQSYAAFMQPTPTPVAVLPTVVPPIVPAAVPEIKKEARDKSERRDNRRRSRSKSRDRKDRSRDRDRKDKRYRDRSRSRSRDRRSSRRRDRSRSKGRSRSRDRDRRSSRDHRKRSEEKSVVSVSQKESKKNMPESWTKSPISVPPVPQPPAALLRSFPGSIEPTKKPTVNNLAFGMQSRPNNNKSFPSNNLNNGSRNNWSNQSQNNFNRDRVGENLQETFQNRLERDNIQNRTAISNQSDKEDSCISLEPFYGGYGDIRRFFQGLFISNQGIKFLNDAAGQRTGTVYVKFGNRQLKEEALSRNGELLNNLTVSINHIDDQEFGAYLDKYIPVVQDDNSNSSENVKYKNKNNTCTCLIVDDLPTYCKEQDILHMFSQHPLVALILTQKPRGGHIAYVKFSSKEVAKKAVEEKSHHVVGGKQVTVKKCPDEVFEEINKQHEVDLGSPKVQEEDIGTDCLSVSRLPLKTNDKDIADFFSDIGVIPTKIHLMSNNLGFTGQAYCEFVNREDTARAAKKHDTVVGNAQIEVVPIKREEMEAILGSTLPAPDQLPIQQPKQHMNITMGSQNISMPNPSVFNKNRQQIFSRLFDKGPRGPRFGQRSILPRHRFAVSRNPQEQFDDIPPGCTVFMKNVPYKAGTNDILDFFEGFNHSNNVSRKYNPNNTPSDEAKVIFFDPDEAARAVKCLQKQLIWERQIFLHQE